MSVRAKSEGFQTPHGVRRTIFLSRLDIKCFQTLSFPRVLSVFSLSGNQQTAPLPPSSIFLCFVSPCLQLFFDVLLGQRSKPEVIVLLLH